MNEMKKYLPYIRKALQDAPNKVDPPTDGALRHKGLDTSKIPKITMSILTPS